MTRKTMKTPKESAIVVSSTPATHAIATTSKKGLLFHLNIMLKTPIAMLAVIVVVVCTWSYCLHRIQHKYHRFDPVPEHLNNISFTYKGRYSAGNYSKNDIVWKYRPLKSESPDSETRWKEQKRNGGCAFRASRDTNQIPDFATARNLENTSAWITAYCWTNTSERPNDNRLKELAITTVVMEYAQISCNSMKDAFHICYLQRFTTMYNYLNPPEANETHHFIPLFMSNNETKVIPAMVNKEVWLLFTYMPCVLAVPILWFAFGSDVMTIFTALLYWRALYGHIQDLLLYMPITFLVLTFDMVVTCSMCLVIDIFIVYCYAFSFCRLVNLVFFTRGGFFTLLDNWVWKTAMYPFRRFESARTKQD